MSLGRVKTWSTNEGLLASDLNAEFDNIRNNPGALISPLTGNIAAAGFRVTDLAAATTNGDLARFDDVPLIATQANQEAASDLTVAVTPGRLHLHPSACKMWATVYGDGTAASSYNVGGITDVGSGQVFFSAAVAFSDAATTVPVLTVDNNGTALAVQCNMANTVTAACSAKTTAGTLTDPQTWSIACFGDYP